MSTNIATQPPFSTSVGVRLVLKLVVALFAAAFIAGGALALLNLMSRHTFTVRSSYAGVRSLNVDSGTGDLQLTGVSTGARLTTVEHVTEDLETPQRVAMFDGSRLLNLGGHCSFLMSIECSVDYDIAVPSGVGVRASSGAGGIIATGLTTTAAISLHSGAGDVNVTGISAPTVHIDAGAGNITARLTTPPTDLQASSGAGDIVLTVPNVAYDLSASSGAGTVSHRGLRTDPNSPRRINVSAGAGDITIRVSH
jgi:hypothetical protein